MSDQAKNIAKATINPCFGALCKIEPMNSPLIPPFEENKIFPEEIDNVNSFMKESTNDLNIAN
jgi:hypothetical protein